MSKSTCRNGGASLFFTTLTRVWLPGHVSSRSLIDPGAADFQPDRGVELQRIAPRRGLRIAEHHPDLQPDLVQEDQRGLALGHAAGQLAQRLAHQPRVQPHMAVAHLAFQLGARHQGGHTIDHHHVDRARSDQRVANLQRLLAGIGLADQQIIDIHPQLARIDRVQRMLRVDKRAGAAALLRLGDHVQSQRGLARAFRPVHLDHPPARHPANAHGQIPAPASPTE